VKFYRVFPFDASAAPNDRGGALFVPPGSRNGRIDNPDLYRVFYVASVPQAAIAETFGRFPIWRAETFLNGRGFPYALATIESPDAFELFDMNDIDALRSIGINRPTDVVTRDREVTQAWARTIFERGGYCGVVWWSFYDPAWQIAGIWSQDLLRLVREPEVLDVGLPVVAESAAMLVRQIER
jgi:hypothetical protein